MFRLLHLSQRLTVHSAASTSRSLVSSALLSRAWHNESIAQLRTEAKSRGLSAKGSKSVLASRIEEYENSVGLQAPTMGARQASTNATSVESPLPVEKTDSGATVISSVGSPSPSQPDNLPEVPGNPEPSSAPIPIHTPVEPEASVVDHLPLADGESDGKIVHTVGSPSPIQPEDLPEVPGNPEIPAPASPYTLDVKIPELNQPIPVAPIQIPFVPDFWDSWKTSSVNSAAEEERLRMLVVGGAGTHYGGGPSHSGLHPERSSEGSPEAKKTDSFIDDLAEDLGLPPVANQLNKTFAKIFSFRTDV